MQIYCRATDIGAQLQAILVPGQVLSEEILHYMRLLDVTEIHGYTPEYGLPVFSQKAIDSVAIPPSTGAAKTLEKPRESK